MNTEGKKKKIVIAIVAFLAAVYLCMRKSKQDGLYYGDEDYDTSYGNSTRKNFNFLLLVVCLFQLGMQMKSHKSVSANISNMVQYVIKKQNIKS
ncbi:hypothetical protein [Bacillus sp. C1]